MAWIGRLTGAVVAVIILQGTVPPPPAAVISLVSPAGPGSGEPNLFVAPDGRAYLSWIETAGEGRHQLYFSHYESGRWSSPQTVAGGDTWFVNWADFPSVAVHQNHLAAHWLQRIPAPGLAYGVRVTLSDDRGRTWAEPFWLHEDQSAAEHGFVSLFPWSEDAFGAVWLDGRSMGESETTGAMELRFRTFGTDGPGESSVVLDERVCSCCQTDAVRTASGVLVAYRDRSDEEVRDISVVRWQDGQWSAPEAVYRDGWQLSGCPVNGPALAAAGNEVAIAWPTQADGIPRVRAAFSHDGGRSFDLPVGIDLGDPLGRVDVVLLEDSSALVSWMEKRPGGVDIMVRRVFPQGQLGTPVAVAPSAASRSTGFPKMARSGRQVLFAWTDTGPPPSIQTAALRIGSDPGDTE